MPNKPKRHDPLPPYLRAKVQAQAEADRKRRIQQYEATPERAADRAWYNAKRWRDFRAYALSLPENALCRGCKAQGIITPSTQLDHVKPRKEFPELAYELSNVQGMCGKCHRAKTQRGQ